MRITIIGSGNLGSHMAKHLHYANLDVHEVFSRSLSKAKAITTSINAKPVTDLKSISPKADVYLLAITDTVIPQVSEILKEVIPPNAIVAHTSGATPSSVLANYFERFGVFYPLQSFSTLQEADFSEVPLCIYAPTLEDQQVLEWIARKLSPKIYIIDDAQRAILHVAAVFANNFSNHFFQISKDLLDKGQMPFELLIPIIEATIEKIKEAEPSAIQTGPAVRGDQATLDRHLLQLQDHPALRALYVSISNHINPKLNLK